MSFEEKISKKVENLEAELKKITEKVSALEKRLKQSSSVKQFELSTNVIKKIDKIPTKDLILVLLKMSVNQSINDLKQNLLKLGWIEDTFFKKNFSASLIKKGLISKTGTDAKKKDQYSLTLKGEILSKELLQKLEK